MSRPLQQLNTHMGHHPGHKHRYSFIETPLEMHASPQYPETARSPPPPATTSPAPQQPTIEHQGARQQHTTHYTTHEHPNRFSHNEKERQLQEAGIIPTYSKYPPIEQHPALYAPIADVPPQQQQQQQEPQLQHVQSPHYSYSYSSPPPGSPGPLPAKATPEAPSRTDTIAIAPDVNPLQSPKSPYFPPPTTAKTPEAPAIDEWSSYHQPGQIMHPNQEVQGGTWSHGLCECSNIGTCCVGLICPCILYGKTQYRLSMKSRKEDPTNMLGYETCNGSCSMMAFLCGCQWLLATIQHTRTRKAYGIKGDMASDCVRATCCTCCTLIQDEKEIQKREEKRGRAVLERGATLTSPYMTPGLLAYPPPPK